MGAHSRGSHMFDVTIKGLTSRIRGEGGGVKRRWLRGTCKEGVVGRNNGPNNYIGAMELYPLTPLQIYRDGNLCNKEKRKNGRNHVSE